MKPTVCRTRAVAIACTVLLQACTVLLQACQTVQEGPYVQVSAAPIPGGNLIEMTAEGLSVPCLVVEAGQTVEWRNLDANVPANVTSLGEPAELYSPILVQPYDQVGYTRVPGCVTSTTEDCLSPPYIWWRHTFARPGIYEYYDTNQGDPGKKVVDPYYGTVKFVGIGPNVKTGIVCVKAPGSDQCNGVCCIKNGNGDAVLEERECPQGQCCDGEKKRCLLGSPMLQVCAGKPAHREFECFDDAQCPPKKDGKARFCQFAPFANRTCQSKAP